MEMNEYMLIFADLFDFSSIDIGATVEADFYKLFDSSGGANITRISESQFRVSTYSTSDIVSLDNVISMTISRIEYLQEIGKFLIGDIKEEYSNVVYTSNILYMTLCTTRLRKGRYIFRIKDISRTSHNDTVVGLEMIRDISDLNEEYVNNIMQFIKRNGGNKND